MMGRLMVGVVGESLLEVKEEDLKSKVRVLKTL